MAILLKSTEEINNPERLHSGKDIDEFFDELFNETPEEKVKRKKELEDYTLRCQANLPEIMDFNEKQKNKLWKALYEEFKKS